MYNSRKGTYFNFRTFTDFRWQIFPRNTRDHWQDPELVAATRSVLRYCIQNSPGPVLLRPSYTVITLASSKSNSMEKSEVRDSNENLNSDSLRPASDMERRLTRSIFHMRNCSNLNQALNKTRPAACHGSFGY